MEDIKSEKVLISSLPSLRLYSSQNNRNATAVSSWESLSATCWTNTWPYPLELQGDDMIQGHVTLYQTNCCGLTPCLHIGLFTNHKTRFSCPPYMACMAVLITLVGIERSNEGESVFIHRQIYREYTVALFPSVCCWTAGSNLKPSLLQ